MMKEFYKKYHMPIIIIIFLIGLGFILSFGYLLLFDKDSNYQNDYYSVSYDGSWSITKKAKDKLVLSHGKGKITFDIVELSNDKIYLDIDSLIDDIKYDIEKNNDNYKLLSKEQNYITKNHFLGYTYLYENNKDNVKVCVYKDSKYIVIITYEANTKYFDILLDSANNIIYNFSLQEKKYDLTQELEITIGKIIFSEKSSSYKNLSDTKDEEIARYNYLVNYSIPKHYQSSKYNSLSGTYTYKGFSDYLKSSDLSVNIYNYNIYEYIKDDNANSLYQKYSKLKENKNYKENIERVEDDKDNFIYKNSYVVPTSLGDNFFENVELLYSLDKNHILVVVFENKNISVSRELIDSFKLNYYKNIPGYINREEKDNKLISFLKYKDVDKDTNITISLPLEYKEVDEKNNVYENRYFVKDYNNNIESYKYKVSYQIFNTEKAAISDVSSLISSNKNNGNYQNLVLEGNKKYHENYFKVYHANYTSQGGLFYEKTFVSNIKLLIYKLSSDKVLSIKVEGNNATINDEIINELTDFIVENK